MRRTLSLVVGLLLLATADGLPRYEKPVASVFFLNGSLVLLSPHEQLWVELWFGGYRSARERLTEPPSSQLQLQYDGVLRDLATWRFTFTPPALSQTKSGTQLIAFNPYDVFYGRYFPELNRILIDQFATRTMTPMELRVLLAHEVGHSIDIQTKRIGHWVFVPEVREYDEQAFADYIARLIVGPDVFDDFVKRYVHRAKK